MSSGPTAPVFFGASAAATSDGPCDFPALESPTTSTNGLFRPSRATRTTSSSSSAATSRRGPPTRPASCGLPATAAGRACGRNVEQGERGVTHLGLLLQQCNAATYSSGALLAAMMSCQA